MTACVAFSGVEKRYGSVTALNHVSLECPAQALTAIVGASGSGKTTLLQTVNGLVRPDSGQVQIFGEPIPYDNLEPFRHGIGYAVQGAGLFPHMTAYENVTLVARLLTWDETRIRDRFNALLEEVDLPASVSDRLPRELSGGQQQRLGLCRALMLQPKLLLLDEPFSAIDPITRADIYSQFETIKQVEAVSALLVTHDLREARRLSEYLVILSDGELQQHGATADVLANPANEYVDKLVQSQLA